MKDLGERDAVNSCVLCVCCACAPSHLKHQRPTVQRVEIVRVRAGSLAVTLRADGQYSVLAIDARTLATYAGCNLHAAVRRIISRAARARAGGAGRPAGGGGGGNIPRRR